MNSPNPKALLVDDTSLFRTLARRRLEALGIGCDEAATYGEAERLLNANEYALLVTELHLPDRHPYHLVMEMLRRPTRPLIVVATDIREPRLAQHLFDEGVEDILFKPVDYALMAAKLKVLAMRWQKQWSPSSHFAKQQASTTDSCLGEQHVSSEDIETKLTHLTGMLPLSTTAFDVFNATRENRFDAKAIEKVIAKEASLAVELLRLANSNAYNSSTEKITSLEQAVVRVGRRKIGELALAHAAKATLTQRAVPWLDTDLIWRRSVAASTAAELLAKHSGASGVDGIVLAALMHGLGRVVLASLYPQLYQELLSRCGETRESLEALESQCFPLSSGQAIARVLELWKLPDSVWRPLLQLDQPAPNDTGRLLDSALAIGNLTTGSWQDFDRVNLPCIDERITASRLNSIITQVAQRQTGALERASSSVKDRRRAPLPYARISSSELDLPKVLLSSFASVESIPLDAIDKTERVVIDCRDAAAYSLAPFVADRTFDPRRLIIANREDAKEFRRFGQVINFPLSYAAFRQACLGANAEKESAPRVIHAIPFQTPIASAFDARL
ncbi:MAG: HDOD domain-containing protein [Planctomycetia bacterium]|nr:HDOD domain-containing protein [Planctomycetia bacterium]